MTTFTSRNVPLVEGTDPADIAARVNPVAQLAHDRPGVSALTTTQRNALTGAELWDGRVILNTTTDRLNRYDLGTTSWVAVADFSEIAALLATTGTPASLGTTASRGVSSSAARADHVHPYAESSATPTYVGGLAQSAFDGSILHKRDRQVTFHLEAQSIAAIAAAVVFMNVPVGFRPVKRTWAAASHTTAGNTPIPVCVFPDGTVNANWPIASGVPLLGHFSYESA